VVALDWPSQDVAGPDEVMPFEEHVSEIVEGRRDVIVCAYDLDEHDAAFIAEVLGMHPLTSIRGKLQPPRRNAPLVARDRILAAAHSHFHTFGIRATGVDTLIEAAGVAKATFYRHFPSKDALVLAWLSDWRSRWFYRVRDELEASGLPPDEKLSHLFRLVAKWLQHEGFRGCAFQNTAVEIPDSTHPSRVLVREYLDEIDAYLRDVVTAAGVSNPEALAGEIGVLLSGALSAGQARHSQAPVLAAGEATRRLLKAAQTG
jgi:AcrR family transcriptional regulator